MQPMHAIVLGEQNADILQNDGLASGTPCRLQQLNLNQLSNSVARFNQTTPNMRAELEPIMSSSFNEKLSELSESQVAASTGVVNGLDLRSRSTASPVVDDDQLSDSKLGDRKIFVGGLCWETTDSDLLSYFSQFGKIESCQIKYDSASQQPRGFGFVIFESADSVQRVLEMRDQHHVRGKRVDPKLAKPSKDVCRKVFVGGLSPNTSYQQIYDYFSKFGKVESLDMPFDSVKCSRRNYVFVAYASKHEAIAASHCEKQSICGRLCDVRIALPRDEMLKLKSRGVHPVRFASPQSHFPCSTAARNYSGPAGTVRSLTASSIRSSQPAFNFAGRFRAPYRSGPAGCSLVGRSLISTNPNAMTSFPQPQSQPRPQPQPQSSAQFPFQIAASMPPAPQQQAPSGYQFCMVDQTPAAPQNVAYNPYFSTPASLLAASQFSQMYLGGAQPQPADLMCNPMAMFANDGSFLPPLDLASAAAAAAASVYSLASNNLAFNFAATADLLQRPLNSSSSLPLGVLYAPLNVSSATIDQLNASTNEYGTGLGVELTEEQKAAADRMNERHVG